MNVLMFLCVVLPFIFAVCSYIIGKHSEKARDIFVILSCLSVFILTLCCALFCYGEKFSVNVCALSFETDGFRCIYACVASFMFLCSSALSPQYFLHHENKNRYYFFLLMTLGATLGVFLSSNLLTTFTFFEIMSFTSYVWVIQEGDEKAMNAGKTYIVIALVGGFTVLMGLFMLYTRIGTLEISELYERCVSLHDKSSLYIPSICLLFGFGAKAGMFPLHIWLPKAHSVAPAPASALLSGVLTKVGIFGILITTCQIMREDELWGKIILVIGVITMLLGAIKAIFSTNIKYVLACSSLSQIGFILVGISMLCLLGKENALAANGTVLYMLNHSLVKLTLFLTIGALYMGAHTLDLNGLRGYGRGKPLYNIVFLIGACSISGVPGTLGYLSKTLVHESIVEYTAVAGTLGTVTEWLFLLSGGLTAAYMCKLYITVFIEKPTVNTSQKQAKPTLLSSASLILSCVMLPVIGVLPHILAEKISVVALPFVNGEKIAHAINYFSPGNLSGVGISLFIGAAVYTLFIRLVLTKNKDGIPVYTDIWPVWLSVETLVYIPIGKAFIFFFSHICDFISPLMEKTIKPLIAFLTEISSFISGIADVTFKPVMKVVSVITRIMCDATDAVIFVLHKTLFRNLKVPHDKRKYEYSRAIGEKIDRRFGNGDGRISAAELFPRITRTVRETTDDITGGFSFALIMACIGICVILLIVLIK